MQIRTGEGSDSPQERIAMTEMDDWQAAQFRDECQRIKQVLDALEEASRAGASRESLETLAVEAGVGEIYRKEHQ